MRRSILTTTLSVKASLISSLFASLQEEFEYPQATQAWEIIHDLYGWECRIEPETGDYIDFIPLGDLTGRGYAGPPKAWKAFLEILARFAEDEGYILWMNDDGAQYRYLVKGKKVLLQQASISFVSIEEEEID